MKQTPTTDASTAKAAVRVEADPARPEPTVGDRLGFLRERSDPRFKPYRTLYQNYEPPPYAFLRDEEIAVVEDWYEDILGMGLKGETGPALVGVMQTFLAVSGLHRVVQLGHYAGFSTLMLGFALRRMGFDHALFTADINAKMTDLTQQWVRRADLDEVVRVYCGDSASPETADSAHEYLGGRPEAVLIDSSHQYAHTLIELDLWYDRLVPGGLLFLHDVSDFAAQFDSTRQGGVRRALDEWIRDKNIECIRLNHLLPGIGTKLNYADGCGLAILQKPHEPADEKLHAFAAACESLRIQWPQHDQVPWSRMTGSLEAMLIGIRAWPADEPQNVRIGFKAESKARIGLAYQAEADLDSLTAEIVVHGVEGPLVESRTTEPFTFTAGTNFLELELRWPDLGPGHRPISIRLRQLDEATGNSGIVCEADRGVKMRWLDGESKPEESEPQTPELCVISVSRDT